MLLPLLRLYLAYSTAGAHTIGLSSLVDVPSLRPYDAIVVYLTALEATAEPVWCNGGALDSAPRSRVRFSLAPTGFPLGKVINRHG